MNFNTNSIKEIKKFNTKNKLKYSLKFASIITPNTIKNLSLINQSTNSTKNKILIKQSYILLIWLMYTQGTYSKFNDNQKVPSFYIHKKHQTKTTKLKTPMAHKTFSQEQFIFKFYTLSITFQTQLPQKMLLSSINNSIYVLLYLRNNLPFFTTNLLFAKNIKFTIKAKDTRFMALR